MIVMNVYLKQQQKKKTPFLLFSFSLQFILLSNSVVFTVLGGLLGGRVFYYLLFGINALSMILFTIRTYSNAIPRPHDQLSSQRRKFFVFLLGMMQPVVAFFLCWLEFTSGDSGVGWFGLSSSSSTDSLGGDALGAGQTGPLS